MVGWGGGGAVLHSVIFKKRNTAHQQRHSSAKMVTNDIFPKICVVFQQLPHISDSICTDISYVIFLNYHSRSVLYELYNGAQLNLSCSNT